MLSTVKLKSYSLEPIKTDNLVATLPKWGPFFEVSFQVWIESYTQDNNDWSELLRFTASENNLGSGGRIPAILVNKGGGTFVVSQVGTNQNYATDVKIKAKAWTKVDIKQYPENGEVMSVFQ